MFYKIIKDRTIVDAMETITYVRQNVRKKVIIACPREICNGIVSSDGTVFWHLEGQPQFIEGSFETVKIVEIEENEYNEIKAVLTDEQIAEDDERIREPITTTEVMEILDSMQKQIDSLTEENTELRAELQALKG